MPVRVCYTKNVPYKEGKQFFSVTGKAVNNYTVFLGQWSGIFHLFSSASAVCYQQSLWLILNRNKLGDIIFSIFQGRCIHVEICGTR